MPSAEQRNTPNAGNYFITADTATGAAAVDYANFTARLVARTIATLCAAAKEVSGGSLFTFAFYGYVLSSATDLQFTGQSRACPRTGARMQHARVRECALAGWLADLSS